MSFLKFVCFATSRFWSFLSDDIFFFFFFFFSFFFARMISCLMRIRTKNVDVSIFKKEKQSNQRFVLYFIDKL